MDLLLNFLGEIGGIAAMIITVAIAISIKFWYLIVVAILILKR